MIIAVIEDERPARSELIYLINQFMEGREETAEVYEASSGQEALELLAEQEVELVFLDIHLGDIEGTVLAPMIRKSQPEAKIVFATAYHDYAEKAFDVEAFNYIVKPYSRQRVEKTMESFLEQRERKEQERKGHGRRDRFVEGSMPLARISVPTEKKLVIVSVKDIAYIETMNRKCVIHTKTGSIASTGTISSYEEKLKECGFFRIQKSYLINLHYVTELYPWVNNSSCVKLAGYEKEVLTVGRSQLKQLKEQLEAY